MRTFLTSALVALSLAGSLTAASAQVYRDIPAYQQESSQPSRPSGPTDRAYLAE
jgi:hypothetical protein